MAADPRRLLRRPSRSGRVSHRALRRGGGRVGGPAGRGRHPLRPEHAGRRTAAGGGRGAARPSTPPARSSTATSSTAPSARGWRRAWRWTAARVAIGAGADELIRLVTRLVAGDGDAGRDPDARPSGCSRWRPAWPARGRSRSRAASPGSRQTVDELRDGGAERPQRGWSGSAPQQPHRRRVPARRDRGDRLAGIDAIGGRRRGLPRVRRRTALEAAGRVALRGRSPAASCRTCSSCAPWPRPMAWPGPHRVPGGPASGSRSGSTPSGCRCPSGRTPRPWPSPRWRRGGCARRGGGSSSRAGPHRRGAWRAGLGRPAVGDQLPARPPAGRLAPVWRTGCCAAGWSSASYPGARSLAAWLRITRAGAGRERPPARRPSASCRRGGLAWSLSGLSRRCGPRADRSRSPPARRGPAPRRPPPGTAARTGSMISSRGTPHVRHADRLEVGPIGLPVVVGETVDGQRLDRGGDARRSSRSAAGRRRSGSPSRTRSSSSGASSSRIRSSWPSSSRERRRRDLGLDRAPRAHRPCRAPDVEPGVGAVRVAQVLAEAHVEAAAEDAAEHGGHDAGAEVARIEAADPREARRAARSGPIPGRSTRTIRRPPTAWGSIARCPGPAPVQLAEAALRLRRPRCRSRRRRRR